MAALAAGYRVSPIDIHDWGFNCAIYDFLKQYDNINGKTVFMNPPFFKGCRVR
jgi:hypothetical protein